MKEPRTARKPAGFSGDEGGDDWACAESYRGKCCLEAIMERRHHFRLNLRYGLAGAFFGHRIRSRFFSASARVS